jgi:hypothetical protein
MSEEENEGFEGQDPEVTESPKQKRSKRKKDGSYPAGSYRLQCTQKVTGTLFDNKRHIRIPAAGQGDVEAAGPILSGSWLHSQIRAGLISVMSES